MNAMQLYEIVKDVPKEAWPQSAHCDGKPAICLSHGEGYWVMTGYLGLPEDRVVDVAYATLMFEASMMRWLENELNGIELDRDSYEHSVQWGWGGAVGNTRIGSLAIACRAVAKEGT